MKVKKGFIIEGHPTIHMMHRKSNQQQHLQQQHLQQQLQQRQQQPQQLHNNLKE